MICNACKKYIEREIEFYKGHTVNCIGYTCKNGAQCSRNGLVKYCLQVLCPKITESVLKSHHKLPKQNFDKDLISRTLK